MDIGSVYPYWEDVHTDLIELLEWLPEPVWDYKPRLADVRSIRQIVLHMIDQERFWIVHLAQGGPWVRPEPADFTSPDLLVEGLVATRKQTMLYIKLLRAETLRAVRTIPTDGEMNTPETNRPVAWLIWRAVEHELYHYGQIQQRRYDALARG
ncbi:MAG: DinB family protein [Capsulimonadaceae bacterium]|nr:DinB family protein [Capsulimonadaceae bacterium]